MAALSLLLPPPHPATATATIPAAAAAVSVVVSVLRRVMPLLLVVREGLWGLSTVRKPGSAGHGGRPPNARRRDPTQGWGAPAAVAGLPYPRTGPRAAKLRPVTASLLIVDDDPPVRRLPRAGAARCQAAPGARPRADRRRRPRVPSPRRADARAGRDRRRGGGARRGRRARDRTGHAPRRHPRRRRSPGPQRRRPRTRSARPAVAPACPAHLGRRGRGGCRRRVVALRRQGGSARRPAARAAGSGYRRDVSDPQRVVVAED